jgi:hypothetical protein
MYQGSDHHKNNAAHARAIANSIKCTCQYCNKQTNKANIKKHENFCYLNPINIKPCAVCGNPIKNKNATTCSHSCSNTYFRSGPNSGNWTGSNYRTVCFHYHKKECVICGENRIVDVHHLDENHNNNSPENLIPLCPTHHMYWHSRHKHLVEQIILDYVRRYCQGDETRTRDFCAPNAAE